MKRRSFLKGVLGVGAGLAATKVIAKPSKVLNEANMSELGFGLDSPIGVAPNRLGMTQHTGSFAKELCPGVQKWYGKEWYEDAAAKVGGIDEIFPRK